MGDIWEEKDLTKPEENSLNNKEFVPNDITKNIKTDSTENLCGNTGKAKMTNGIVYKATCLINNRVYIGITTKTLEERKNGHICWSKHKTRKYIFHKALRKYGIDNFIFEKIDEFIGNEDACKKERFYVDKYNSFYKNGFGYNMTLGGEGVLGHKFNHTEETKKRISLSMAGTTKSDEVKNNMKLGQAKRNMWYKCIVTDKTKKKISLALKGKKRKNPMSDETKMKLRDSNTGKKLSKETIEKIRESNTGKKRSESCKLLISKIKTRAIPDSILNTIKIYHLNGLTPYHISRRLEDDHNYKIDRGTVKKRILTL